MVPVVVRQTALFLLVLLVSSSPAQAQMRRLIPKPVEPDACPEGLQAAGIQKAPPTGLLQAAYDSIRDTTMVMAGHVGPRLMSFHDGVVMVTEQALLHGHAPADFSYLQLTFMTQRPAARSIDERRLVFLLPDSLVIGALSSFPSTVPGGSGVREYLTAMLTRDQALALAQAPKIRGNLGTTPFEFSSEERQGVQALVLYSKCGGR